MFCCYFFIAAKGLVLKNLLLEAISRVFEFGGIVKGVVCDQGTTNRSMFSLLGVSPSNPYFDFEGQRIYFFYDAPHLMKSLRNNFLKYNFNVGRELVKFQYVKEFYEKESQLPIKQCPKLTPKHIELTNFSKMKVSLATQLLSHSVAAGMSTYVALGALHKDAMATANFIQKADQMFDAFNSGIKFCTLKPHRGAITPESLHIPFLMECLQWVNSWQPIGVRSALPFIGGWRQSIQSLLMLWEDLYRNHEVQYLLTNRLNQDCLENLFGVIRQSGACRDNPTPEQFGSAIRHSVINMLLKPTPGANCELNSDAFLATFKELAKFKKQYSAESTPTISTCSTETTSCADSIPSTSTSLEQTSVLPQKLPANLKMSDIVANLPEKNTLHYIAGYIILRLQKKNHPCVHSKCNLDSLQEENQQFTSPLQTLNILQGSV